MFTKKAYHKKEEGLINSLKAPSLLNIGLNITGDLKSDSEIQVDCQIEGDVDCKVLIIGPNGNVTGNISAESVRIRGLVKGDIMAHTVFLGATARVIGNIYHESVSMEPGAFLDGACHRRDEIEEKPVRKASFRYSKKS